MRNLLFILLFPIFVCSCTSEAVIVQKLESWLERHANNYSYCVIIPGAGCEGCILEGEYFAKEYAGRPDILFIFTRIETLKLLKYKLGEEIASNPNIVFDTDNYFEEIEKGKNNIYPVVFRLNNSKITDFHYVSPEQPCDIIGDLKKELDSHPVCTINLVDYLENGGKNDFSLSSLTDEICYVPLQTPSDIPVDMLLSVKFSKENIFVLDRSQCLFRFDGRGRFLNLIGKRGEGPEEYLNTVSFDIDEETETIHLFDVYRHKLLSYSFSGEFIQSVDVPLGINSLVQRNDSCFIGYKPWYASNERVEQLVFFDKQGKAFEILSMGDNLSDVSQTDIHRTAVFNVSSGICKFTLPFETTVYSLRGDNRWFRSIEVKLDDYQLPRHIAVSTEQYNKHLNDPYVYELNLMEWGNYVYLSFFFRMEHYRVVYDTVEKEFYTIFKGRYPEGVVNDIDKGASFWPMWIDEDRAVGFISPDTLEEGCENEQTNALYESFRDYDNPVLQVIVL